MAVDYPSYLPLPLHDGHSVQHVSPLLRTDLATGRARQRRKYTSVPSIVSVSWIMSSDQAALFEAWFRYTALDGAEWCNITLRTPYNLIPVECRFVDIYSGPELLGRDHWKFTAELETKEREIMPEGWLILPQFWLNKDVFDYAVNQELPGE